ncbi:MAG: uroporphyrinogen decarboxylase family protein [Kiritimatiellae bacterium]|nr:uroporphyrinogen decarboxylase family protein [Kiritimatiellia bacterium]
MTSYECVKRTIEFRGPQRLAFDGNLTSYAPQGDAVFHFARQGLEWWKGGGGTDEWGCVWETNRANDMGQVRRHPLTELAAFADRPRPDGLDPLRYAHLEEELDERPDAYHVLCNGHAVFERMHFLRGFEALLMDMVTDPETVRRFADWVIQYQLDTTRYLAEHFQGRIHAVRCTDDLGTQGSSIMSPATFRAVLKPCYERLAGFCHDHGLHFWLHSCGRIDGLMDDLIDAGVDVVNMAQPLLFDLGELGRRFAGRITFENSPDVQRSVPTCDPDVLRADIGRQLECLATPTGGYIVAGLNRELLQAGSGVDDPGILDLIMNTYRQLDPYRRMNGSST